MSPPVHVIDRKFPTQGGRPVIVTEEQFAACCCKEIVWAFTEEGMNYRGQPTLQSYSTIPTSAPWFRGKKGLTVRFSCEPDNGFTQKGTATAVIKTKVARPMSIAWRGMAEGQADTFDLFNLTVNGTTLVSAHSPGGGNGYTTAPAIFSTASPKSVALVAGENTVSMTFDSVDSQFNTGVFYEITIS
jgi:hypothetical protein